MHSYKTISSPSLGEYKEKGSRFIGYAYNVETTDDVKLRLSDVKSEHPKARHHCYAYRLGFYGMHHRAFDDGEPSGTAGKPILGQIDSFDVTNTLIVVVRYFGGVLLGASGLNHAYKSAARLSLEAANIVEREIMLNYNLHFSAALLPNVMNLMKKHKIKTSVPQYNDDYSMDIFVPAALNDALVTKLSDMQVKIEAF